MQVDDVTQAPRLRLAAAGSLTRDGGRFTFALAADEEATTVPDLAAGLAALGARMHAVEPELGILRAGPGGEPR